MHFGPRRSTLRAANAFFFNLSFNKCIVESEVSNVEAVQCSERPLKDENVEKLNLI